MRDVEEPGLGQEPVFQPPRLTLARSRACPQPLQQVSEELWATIDEQALVLVHCVGHTSREVGFEVATMSKGVARSVEGPPSDVQAHDRCRSGARTLHGALSPYVDTIIGVIYITTVNAIIASTAIIIVVAVAVAITVLLGCIVSQYSKRNKVNL